MSKLLTGYPTYRKCKQAPYCAQMLELIAQTKNDNQYKFFLIILKIGLFKIKEPVFFLVRALFLAHFLYHLFSFSFIISSKNKAT